ncbi:MAG: acetyl-CoA acetyltransferase [Deltaproteobacteria bacterium RIFCSPLOWO2_12_FULL_40_28]|nr:MAG: acetyl-CoA acetyltransferase [Deltaproteobacteria bacterium RIFCSPHIGHO2_02_FULL_40_28]OGQ20943.1 MAG: acetyl-CoA acetyltransferase [Deltaproteobacteria bacterium RIFCSPHIGHO2_12_FULL_40_32]OGQ39344.1 MAG: acetyl-CoA acetyltransferase [Deltaproteobacteria bacterium RIFCSPLOWO2_02_FULL_40_36]OGQ54625.1 MAG: acetyl-CoA acetyltransferase [Deltaproteobacteria bacterium RIFCSPLOWO2_12_FULL_40_28]
MKETVIVSAARTPVGSFLGSLAPVSAPQLGAIAIKEAVKRATIKGSDVEEVIMGCVLTAALGQSPARQALLGAGLPKEVGALTIGKVCGSGLKSVMLADQMIRSGDREIMIAGGMESMSNSPYALSKVREGLRMGHGQLLDTMIQDGLWDPYNNKHMGNCAEMCAKEYKVTRQMQDDFAAESYRRAQKSVKEGIFKEEIVPVPIPQKGGESLMVAIDEEPGKGKIEKLPSLRAAFEKEGTVTAGNASSINDGAAALVVMSADRAKALGLKPLARILSQAQASREPEWFTMAPADAMDKALKKAKLLVNDIDLFEVNEAFSVVAIANNNKLGIPADRVNIRGGAVAIGHPIGASGARILVTLLYALKQTGKKKGLASLCIGGGEGVALIVEAL